MPFDGLAIRAICSELNSDLTEARIDKIYQPEKDEIILSLRQPKSGTVKLLISANSRWARMHVSTQKKENPASPPAFCMLLRKYLEGGKIKAIRQVDFERIVHIDIEALDDFREWRRKTLICEFMGRHSNIILVNPETNIIIDAIKKYGSDLSSYREVLPGREYIVPPSQGKLNPLDTSFEQFTAFMWQDTESKPLSKSLFNTYSGISPKSAEEICSLAGLDPYLPVDQCGDYELSTVFTYLNELLRNLDKGVYQVEVVYKNTHPIDFAPYHMNKSNDYNRTVHCESMNSACDRFYGDKLKAVRLESMKTNLSRNISEFLNKAYKKQFHLEGDRNKAEENKKYKQWGELLTAYAYQYKKGDTLALLDDFYSSEQVEIELDPRYTPIQNAQKYFKIYNKSRSALKHLDELMHNNQQEIDYLESVLVAVKEADSPEEIDEIVDELEKESYIKEKYQRSKTKPVKSTPRRFISSDGLEILVGRNNRQNDLLTLKQADKNDLWLHTKEIPGTHVIVKLPPKLKSIHEVPDTTIEEAAALAAYYSKAKDADKVPVDYTFRSNVRKPGGAKPGMVIYENYWTVMANPRSDKVQILLDSQVNP